MVPAAATCWRRDASSRCATSCARRTSTTRRSRRRRGRRSRRTWIPALRQARTLDGTYNDLHFPKMGAAGRRFGRNVPLDETFPDAPNLHDSESARREPRADDARAVPAGDDPQPARGVVDPVHGARLVRAQALRRPTSSRSRRRRATISASPASACRVRVPDPAPPGSTRPPAYVNLNSHWWDASQIYGSDAATASKLRTKIGGKLRMEPTGLLPVDPETGLHLHRVHRQLVDRPGHAPQPVHAGAQLSLRSARARAPGLERRSALPDRQADQLGADGQDPHRRVDARDCAAPGDSAGVERELVGAGGRGSAGGAHVPRRQGAARRHRRLERRPPHARRTR